MSTNFRGHLIAIKKERYDLLDIDTCNLKCFQDFNFLSDFGTWIPGDFHKEKDSFSYVLNKNSFVNIIKEANKQLSSLRKEDSLLASVMANAVNDSNYDNARQEIFSNSEQAEDLETIKQISRNYIGLLTELEDVIIDDMDLEPETVYLAITLD